MAINNPTDKSISNQIDNYSQAIEFLNSSISYVNFLSYQDHLYDNQLMKCSVFYLNYLIWSKFNQSQQILS